MLGVAYLLTKWGYDLLIMGPRYIKRLRIWWRNFTGGIRRAKKEWAELLCELFGKDDNNGCEDM